MIRLRCPNPECRKPLGVKDQLAGKRVSCPSCKKPLVIPMPKAAVPTPGIPQPGIPVKPPAVKPPTPPKKPTRPLANVDDLAAAALSDAPAKPVVVETPKTIDFTCPFCDEELHLAAALAGTQSPCPECRRIIKIPELKVEKPKDWREVGPGNAADYLRRQGDVLEGVQGDVHSKASTRALVEAGAIEEAPVPPVGIRGWARRLAWATSAVLVLAVVVWGISQARLSSVRSRAIAAVLARLKQPDNKLPPLVRAELLQGCALLELDQGHAAQALEYFRAARGNALDESANLRVDQDLFLKELALQQVMLGGSELEVRQKRKFDWQPVAFQEMRDTVERIQSIEVQLWAARELGARLLTLDKRPLAMLLAQGSRDAAQVPAIKAVQFALLFGPNDKLGNDLAGEMFKAPTKGKPADPLTRLAYAEGYARRGQMDDALEMVSARGLPKDRLEAALAVLAVSADDKILDEALKAASEEKKSLNPWFVLQLARHAARAGKADKVQPMLGGLPKEFRTRAEFELMQAKWQREKSVVPPTSLDALPPDDSKTPRMLAFYALIVHNARLGQPATIPETDGAVLEPLVSLGNLVGTLPAPK